MVSRLIGSTGLPPGGLLRIELEGVPVENPLWKQALTFLTVLIGLGFALTWARMARQERRVEA